MWPEFSQGGYEETVEARLGRLHNTGFYNLREVYCSRIPFFSSEKI